MSEEKKKDFSRRSFALGAGGAVALLGLGGAVKVIGGEPVVRPPGGQDEDAFIGACLRCEKCREVCPLKAIIPAKLEKGLINARTPTFDFKQGWCDYCAEANNGVPLCVEVCPTEALKLPVGATPETVILGKAYIVREWCLGWQLKGCRKCYDECPYEAMELDEYARPSVIGDVCNGCGKCELVCISMMSASITSGATDRAITVKPTETVEKLLAVEQEGGAA
jgi:ferredoxin-type protein NapG